MSFLSSAPSSLSSDSPASEFSEFPESLMPAGPSEVSGKVAISTEQAPAAIGPYSQAVRAGEMVFTSGQIPIDPTTGSFVPGGVAEQTVQVCENLKAVLLAAGLGMEQVVKTTVFLKDMKDFAAMNEVYSRYFSGDGVVSPARSTVQVVALPKDALVEIDCVARG